MIFLQNKFTKWMRNIHRDLGYFVVGMTIVYSVSGILLNHMNGSNPAVGKTVVEKKLPPFLDKDKFRKIYNNQLSEHKLTTVINDGQNYKIYVNGGTGYYNYENGNVKLEIMYNRPVVEFINKLHYNQKKGWMFFADFFAVALILLALTGLFIVKGKNGFLKRGVWFMALGIIIFLFYL